MATTTIQRLDHEPIIVVTHRGTLDVDDLTAFAPVAAKMQQESGVPLYWVIDVSVTTTDFAQILKMLAQQSQVQPGTAANAPNRVFLVGSEQMTRFFQQAMRQPQFGSLDIPMFPNLDDALEAVRVRIQS